MNGEMSRRAPAPTAPAVQAGSVPGAVGSAGAAGGVVRVAWRRVPHVGWDLLPAAAGELLAAAGLCVGVPVAAWAYPDKVRRLHVGGFVGDVEGWWASPAVFVAVRARRPLAPDPNDGRRYRPTGGPWRVRAVVHPLTGTTQTQRWRRPPDPPGHPTATPAEIHDTSEVLDLLPAAVRQQLGHATEQGGARFYPAGGGYREQVVGYRRDPTLGGDRLLVAAGERSASAFPDPEQAIAAADWVITTLDVVLGAAVPHELPAAGPPVAAAAVSSMRPGVGRNRESWSHRRLLGGNR